MEAATHLLERGLLDTKVALLSDSQAALKALRSVSTNSELILDCKKLLNAGGQNNDT